MQRLFLKFSFTFSLVATFMLTTPLHSPAVEQTLLNGNLSLLKAVNYTIAHETNIKMEESQVTVSLGTLQIASGQFDTSLNTQLKSIEDDAPFSETDAMIIGHAHQLTQTYSLSQSATKTFRYGTSIDSSIGIQRTDNQYPEGTPDTDNGTISFSLTQPLLRGKGTDVTGATEASKKELYQAELYTLRQTVSSKIYNTVTAYWNYQGAQEIVQLYKKTIQTINESILKLQDLIDGGEQPASDMNNYLATLATRKIDLLSAQQQLLIATETLAVAMGIPYTQEIPIPAASKKYPVSDISSLQQQSQRLTELALINRCDLASMEHNLTAAKYLLDASRSGMLAQLDFSFNLKYSNVLKGDEKQDDTSVSAWLDYEIPVGNNTATGQMITARAAFKQIQYQIEGLKRSICSQVSDSVNALSTYSYIKKQYESTVSLNEQRVKDETTQYSLGTSDLLNVISVEDNLTTTQVNLVGSKVNMANALIQLRYVTGTILAPDQTTYHINTNNLTTVPENLSTLRR